jgi:hypothetical protein
MTKIFELKLVIKEGSELRDRSWIIASKKNIIYINQKSNEGRACSLGKQRIVTLELNKAMIKDSGRKLGEPLPGGLFQTIQGLG